MQRYWFVPSASWSTQHLQSGRIVWIFHASRRCIGTPKTAIKMNGFICRWFRSWSSPSKSVEWLIPVSNNDLWKTDPIDLRAIAYRIEKFRLSSFNFWSISASSSAVRARGSPFSSSGCGENKRSKSVGINCRLRNAWSSGCVKFSRLCPSKSFCERNENKVSFALLKKLTQTKMCLDKKVGEKKWFARALMCPAYFTQTSNKHHVCVFLGVFCFSEIQQKWKSTLHEIYNTQNAC